MMTRQRPRAVYATLFWKTGAMVDFAEVDTLAAGYHQRGGQPGLAYGIVVGGELVHAGGLGQPVHVRDIDHFLSLSEAGGYTAQPGPHAII